MAKINRSANIPATPEAIWEYLAEPTHWPEWDPDMVGVDADGPGFENGQVWKVRLDQPISATVEFANVELHRRLDWSVRALAGLLRSQATFRFEPMDDGSTTFYYEFEMGGVLGALIQRLRSSVVARGVDDGLRNIAAATGAGSPG